MFNKFLKSKSIILWEIKKSFQTINYLNQLVFLIEENS